MPEAIELVTNANSFKRPELADNEVFGRPLHFAVQARTNCLTTISRGWAREAATARSMGVRETVAPRGLKQD